MYFVSQSRVFKKEPVSVLSLIEGCKQGDRKSQQALYMHFADHVMNTAYRYARDLSEAEDILQNAFIKAFENIKSFDVKKGTFDAWLSRIVINEALQLLKKNRRYLLVNKNDEEVFDTRVEPNVFELLEAEEIHALMNQLPDGYRVVFNLYVVEEYSHKEIAELLEITESASRSQLTRAKAMLKKLVRQAKNFRLTI